MRDVTLVILNSLRIKCHMRPLSELRAFFWFDLEPKVMGQKGGHVLDRRT